MEFSKSVTKLLMFIFAVFLITLSRVVLFLSQQTVDLTFPFSSIPFPTPPPPPPPCLSPYLLRQSVDNLFSVSVFVLPHNYSNVTDLFGFWSINVSCSCRWSYLFMTIKVFFHSLHY